MPTTAAKHPHRATASARQAGRRAPRRQRLTTKAAVPAPHVVASDRWSSCQAAPVAGFGHNGHDGQASTAPFATTRLPATMVAKVVDRVAQPQGPTPLGHQRARPPRHAATAVTTVVAKNTSPRTKWAATVQGAFLARTVRAPRPAWARTSTAATTAGTRAARRARGCQARRAVAPTPAVTRATR